MIEPLESRTFFSYSLMADGTLRVVGGAGNDFLNVYPIKDSVAVDENGNVTAAFKKVQVKRIVMFGMAGNDTLLNSTGIPCIMYGGDGNDTLNSGDSMAQLYGGDGNDTLYGGKYGVSMYGGNDQDNLQGGSGDDILSPDEGTDETVNGGSGRNILILPPKGSTVTSESNIQVTKPNSYVPANSVVPVGISAFKPKLSLSTLKNGNTLLTVNYTLPNNKAEAIFSPAVMNVNNTLTIDVITTNYTGKSTPTDKPQTVSFDLGKPPAGYAVRVRGLAGTGASIKGLAATKPTKPVTPAGTVMLGGNSAAVSTLAAAAPGNSAAFTNFEDSAGDGSDLFSV